MALLKSTQNALFAIAAKFDVSEVGKTYTLYNA